MDKIRRKSIEYKNENKEFIQNKYNKCLYKNILEKLKNNIIYTLHITNFVSYLSQLVF